jgi:hypothetical protein
MPELIGRGPVVYAMTAAGLALIYGLPRLHCQRDGGPGEVGQGVRQGAHVADGADVEAERQCRS